jgi:hypothetical protein
MRTSISLFLILLSAALLQSVPSYAQGLGAYVDERNRFIIWDSGEEKVVENLGVREWTLSPNYITYIDLAGELHVYGGGEIRPLSVANPRYYIVSDNLLRYGTGDNTTLLDKGRKHFISFNQGQMARDLPAELSDVEQGYMGVASSDSVAAFNDYNGWLHIYYQNEFREISKFRGEDLKAFGNMVCWLDQQQRLRAFWQGKSGIIDPQGYLELMGGNNILIWTDIFNRAKIFHRGQLIEPSSAYLPEGGFIGVGDDIACWVDENEELWVYQNGKAKKLLTEAPKEAGIKDQLLWFVDLNGYFSVFYEGEIILLETFEPMRIEAHWNVLAYQDIDGRLRAFYKGEKINISDQIAQDWDLNGDLIQWSERPFNYEFFRR